MKLRNQKITKQLNLGLGTILLLVIILCVVALIDAENLWQDTKGLYENPLMVRKAISEIEINVLSMHLEMKNLVAETNEQKIGEHLQMIDVYEGEAYRQVELLYDRYQGPQRDIDDAYKSLVQWKTIRVETIRLLRAGEVNEAINRTKSSGVGGAQVKNIQVCLATISDFANNRADQFYLNAQNQKTQVVLQLAVLIIITLLFSLGISFILRKAIMTPLRELLTAINAFQQGKLGARSEYVSRNEFGALSDSFNFMAETLQWEMQDKDKVAQVSASLLEHDELRPFCQELLKTLLQHTGAQVGAVYLLNGQKNDYEHFESIGLKAGARAAWMASDLEGEFGAVIATRQIQRLTNIPADTRFISSTVSGDFLPKEIMTIPVINGSKVIAVISLTSICNFPDVAVRLINNIFKELTARLNSVLATQQIIEFSQMLQNTNLELDMQAKELAMQKDELTEQNIELELQKRLLDEASQLKSSFLSNMSHELRTPLNSVISLASVLNRRLRGAIPEEEYSYLGVIERNGKHLLSIINDILDLSRIEAGKEEISLSLFNIQQVVAEVVEMIEPQAQEKGIALLSHVTSDLPNISSDMSKCRHILQNIVANSVKFTKEGKVEIKATRTDDEIHIAVTDTGIGIAADQLHYIFDEFRQGDETTSRQQGGTGLGLAIAQKYAKLVGGSIAVVSRPGKGSTFTLRLPLVNDQSKTDTETEFLEFGDVAKSPEQSIWSMHQGKRILLVEDSEPAIIQMKDILTEQGYQIQVARSGKMALENIEKILPDGIILDLMIPEMDGFQILKTIRSVENTSQIPVLILTAKQISKEELKFLKGNHIFQLIQKGAIGKTELLAAVGNMVLLKESEPKKLPLGRFAWSQTSERPVILVVEDNLDNMTTVKALLKQKYDIIEAADGQAGLEQAKQHRPSLILLDISLPVMDGFQVFRELRKEETLRQIPVIALTARVMVGNKDEILALGFDGYVSKPIDEEFLEEAIRRVLDAK